MRIFHCYAGNETFSTSAGGSPGGNFFCGEIIDWWEKKNYNYTEIKRARWGQCEKLATLIFQDTLFGNGIKICD